MPSNSTTFPPLGTGRPGAPQRPRTAHTASSSLPLAGSARVSTRPLLPPHHMMRRQPHHHHRQHHLHLQQHYSPQTHRRHVSDTPGGAGCSVADHLVELSDAPELPEISELLRQGAASRATIVQMIEHGICRTSFNDVQRFPAIHPSIMSARMERIVRYITFVSAPPIERRAPKDRPKSWDRKAYKRLGPEECFRCQLQTDHAVCERHKYLRVGGGFRHSYWYIKQTMDVIEAEHRKVAEEVRQRYMAELASKARQAQTRRRIKTYVRGADGKLVSRYCFVTEEEYQEMKKDVNLARKILGVADGEELEDWVSSKRKYVVDENGQIVKVSSRKIRDSAYEESIESADVNNNYSRGKDGRRRGRKGRHRRGYDSDSDSDSFESGMGNSLLEEGEGGRGRRRRHRRRYSSVESVESYISEGGTRRERKVRRRRRRRSWDGSESSYYEDEDGKKHRRRRRHRRRSYSGSDSGTGLDSGDSRYGRRRHGGRRGGRHRRHRGGDYSGDEYSSGSYDSRDGSRHGGRRRGGRRGRGRRGRYSSYSDDDSYEDGSRSGRRRGGRRHRRRHRSYSDDSDLTSDDEGGGGRRRRGRHRRSRHRGGHGSDSSDYSGSDDSRGRGRRHHRLRHRGRGHGSGDDGSWSDRSSSEGGHGGRGHRRGRLHRRRRYSDDSGTSFDSDSVDGEGGARGGRRRRRRHRRSDSYSDSYSYSDDDSGDGKGRGRRRRHRRRRYSDDSDASFYSDDDDEDGGGRRRGRRKGGKKGGRRGRGRRRGGASGSYDSEDYSGSEGSYSSSYYSSDDVSSSESLPLSSEVSDASNPSSVHSSDLSSIDSDLDEEERERVKAKKKAKKLAEKRAAKQEKKIEARKEAREAKREQIRQEKRERRRERRRERDGEGGRGRGRGPGRDTRDKRRRHRTPTSRDVSVCSSVSSVRSDDISDVDSALVGEERERAIQAKKAKKKAEKKAIKQKAKVQKVQEEHWEKRREKERQRIKREIEREMERMSTPSDISSVRSSELSSLSDAEGLTEEEKVRKKAEKKQKKKEEKKKERKMLKAVQKVMAKRKKRRGSGSSDDSYARGKQDFYDLPPEVQKTMVKYSKGSKRGLLGEEGMEWLDDWKNKKERDKRKKKSKKGKEEFTGEMMELRAPDGRVIRVPKTSMYDVWKQTKKVRLKKDGTVARDSDSDAETIEIDSDGNMTTQPKNVELKEAGYYASWDGFAEGPDEPPATPTQGGRIKFHGVRKVQHAFRKDKGVLTEHLKRVLDTASELNDPRPGERAEASGGSARGAYAWESVDFISHFRLVESYKLDPLGRAFVVEDVDYDCSLNGQEMRAAVEGVPSLSSIKPKQLEYVLKVLNIDDHTAVSFKMFAVVAGVCERMCNMDSFGKYILDKTDLLDIARKMALYKSIFYCNVNSERSDNHITAESLRIELMAGGLNREQERYIMSKMNPNEFGEISFFDYIAYIPLFLSMHENIIDNPLDRQEKYTRLERGEVQRDMNPMGLPLQRSYLAAPKEIFPSGLPVRPGEDGSPVAGARGFIQTGELLDGGTVGGKSGRLPSIIQKPSSPMAIKRGGGGGGRGKTVSMSLP